MSRQETNSITKTTYRNWTSQEDHELERIVTSYKDADKKMKDAYQYAAKKLNHSPGACQVRWSFIKKKRSHSFKNHNPSDVQYLSLKIKELERKTQELEKQLTIKSQINQSLKTRISQYAEIQNLISEYERVCL